MRDVIAASSLPVRVDADHCHGDVKIANMLVVGGKTPTLAPADLRDGLHH